MHRVIKFNRKFWLKRHSITNTKLRKYAKNEFEKYFFKLSYVVFRKSVENVKMLRDIKVVRTDARKKHLVSEPNYQTAICFPKNF